MNQYMITYLGGDQPSSPEAGKQQFARYQEWLTSLDDSAVKPMVPFKNIHTISPDGSAVPGSSVSMSGHTIIQAESIEAAISIARACPFLETNGSLEVAEIVQMSS